MRNPKVKKKALPTAYSEGYKAFKKQMFPKSCPYLNRTGDNSSDICDWMQGWSDAANDLIGDFVLGQEKDH